MPNDNGYVIDAATIQRIAKAVREFESGVKKPGMVESYSDPLADGESYIEIISTTATAGRYNAIEKVVRPDTGGWQYSNVQCYAEELNGGTLATGSTYKGTIKTSAIDAGTVKKVFSVQASGSGGSTLVFVKSTSATTGVITTYNPNAIPGLPKWTEGATSVPLVEANDNVIPVGKRMLALQVGTVYIVGLDPVAVTNVVCSNGTLTVTRRS